jgi:hypothetical protein
MSVLDEFQSKFKVSEGRTLIVGSKVHEGTSKRDRREIYPNAIGVDMEDGHGVDRVLNLEEEIPDGFGAFDHIECTSVLEHSRRPWLLAANLERVMKDGGTIMIMIPWVWRIHNYPSDLWRMTPEAIKSLFPSVEWLGQSYIVEGRLVQKVPTLKAMSMRWMARSELIMFGKKCASTS